MGDFHALGQAVPVDHEAVVLTGNQHVVFDFVEHGVIGAVMTEVHFRDRTAEGQAQKLVAEANTEQRHAHLGQHFDARHGVGRHRHRIARAVG